jgi:hypothetical protein
MEQYTKERDFILIFLDWYEQTCRIMLAWISLEIGQRENNVCEGIHGLKG